MSNPFHFEWPVASGAQLVTATVGRIHCDGVQCQVLTTDLPLGSRCKVRTIEPLDRPALFSEFAELDGEDAIVAFANAFGLLGFPRREAALPRDRAGDIFVIRGELLSDWLQQVKYMRRALTARIRKQAKAVSEAINAQLDGQINACFSADAGLVFTPATLLAAMWLQFAFAVDGNKQYAKCPCGNWIEMAPGARRAKTDYCSGACKQRAYRARKAGD